MNTNYGGKVQYYFLAKRDTISEFILSHCWFQFVLFMESAKGYNMVISEH